MIRDKKKKKKKKTDLKEKKTHKKLDPRVKEYRKYNFPQDERGNFTDIQKQH